LKIVALRCLANDARLKETPRVLEVSNQILGAVARTDDAQVKRDVAVLGANGLKR
jgi:hypothetical protein